MADNFSFEQLVIPGLQDFFLDGACSPQMTPIPEIRLILRFEGAPRVGEYAGTILWYPATQMAA
jgi:hypothetical protein